MAVTQQLARLTPEQLAACQRDELALDQLLSFKAASADHYLDLDWAGESLVMGLADHGAKETARLLANLFGEEAEIVNHACPTGSSGHIAYSEITVMDQASVQQLVLRLQHLSPDRLDLICARASTRAAEKGVISFADARQYFQETFARLLDFLQSAASREQAVVAWWD